MLPTAGYLSSGVSATLLIAIGSRVLSAAAFSGLFVAWTIVNAFGFGVGTPTEQLISRRMNAGAPGSLRPALFRLLLAVLISAVVTVGVAVGSPQARDFPLLVPTALIAITGWTALVIVRGRLAGCGDLLGYAGLLAAESVVRILLLGACLLLPGQAMVLMAAAVAVPFLVAAVLGAVIVIPRALPGLAKSVSASSAGSIANAVIPEEQGQGTRDQGTREQLGFVMVSVGYQVCLQAAVLLLAWRSGAARPAVVGAFGAANSYFRTPTVLTGGVTTHALVMLSHAWGAGDLDRVRTALRRALRQGVVLGLGGTLLLCLMAPVLLPIYYHHPLGLPLHLLAGLAVSTVLTVLAAIMVQPLLATGRSGTAALVWLAGGTITVLMFMLSSGTDWLATWALICGPSIAMAIATAGVWRLSQTDLAGVSLRAVQVRDAPVTGAR